MTTETVNLSGLIQPLTPVMIFGSSTSPARMKGIRARFSRSVRVSGRLKAQACWSQRAGVRRVDEGRAVVMGKSPL